VTILKLAVGRKAAWTVQRQTGNVTKDAIQNPTVDDEGNVGAGSLEQQVVDELSIPLIMLSMVFTHGDHIVRIIVIQFF
jgi:hypothetical protein